MTQKNIPPYLNCWLYRKIKEAFASFFKIPSLFRRFFNKYKKIPSLERLGITGCGDRT